MISALALPAAKFKRNDRGFEGIINMLRTIR